MVPLLQVDGVVTVPVERLLLKVKVKSSILKLERALPAANLNSKVLVEFPEVVLGNACVVSDEGLCCISTI